MKTNDPIFVAFDSEGDAYSSTEVRGADERSLMHVHLQFDGVSVQTFNLANGDTKSAWFTTAELESMTTLIEVLRQAKEES